MAGRVWDLIVARPRLFLVLLCLCLFLPGLTSLPPLDRDESRFAQASKQMLETGDFVAIRFQDEPRNKKPIGIYWLQAASASVFSAPPHDTIWAYRIPSVLAAIGAVLLTFWLGQVLFDREVAVTAGALIATSLLLIGEAHIAKTDAALLCATLAAMVALARAFLRPLQAGTGNAILFGAGLGASILIKGPVGPMVIGLTALVLWLGDRGADWPKRLKPWISLPIALVIVLPWAVAIWVETDGQFYRDALLGDFGGKLVSGQERHGGWPGYYLLLVSATLWPAALFLVPAALATWQERRDPVARFLIAWALPSWIIFELTPTKLPHYPLPLYPALALAIAAYVQRPLLRGAGLTLAARISAGIFAVVGATVAAAFIVLPMLYGAGAPWWNGAVAAVVLAGVAATTILALLKRRREAGASAIAVGAVAGIALMLLVVPQLDKLTVSVKAADLVREAGATHETIIAASGYAEPSLVFLAGTSVLLGPPEASAAAIEGHPGALALIEQGSDAAFQAAIEARGVRLETLGSAEGLNYSKGDPVIVTLYRVLPGAP